MFLPFHRERGPPGDAPTFRRYFVTPRYIQDDQGKWGVDKINDFFRIVDREKGTKTNFRISKILSTKFDGLRNEIDKIETFLKIVGRGDRETYDTSSTKYGGLNGLLLTPLDAPTVGNSISKSLEIVDGVRAGGLIKATIYEESVGLLTFSWLLGYKRQQYRLLLYDCRLPRV